MKWKKSKMLEHNNNWILCCHH